jgi:hypothetical protein
MECRRLAGPSTFCFPAGRVFLAAHQQWVRSRCTSDLLRLATYDRCEAQFEFLNRFDSGLFVHCSTCPRKNKRLTKRSSKLPMGQCRDDEGMNEKKRFDSHSGAASTPPECPAACRRHRSARSPAVTKSLNAMIKGKPERIVVDLSERLTSIAQGWRRLL